MIIGNEDWNSYRELARDVVSKALRDLEGRGWGNAGVLSDSGRDLKTEADFQSDAILKNGLSNSPFPIISEESSTNSIVEENQITWIIDPLDGTVNFERGFPHAAVSVGLWCGGKPLFGVVGNLKDGTIWEDRGPQDLLKSGQHVCVSSVQRDENGVLATGFPTSRDFSDRSLLSSAQIWRCFKKVRMIGSAALSLAMVADGTFDAYCEEGIWWWDVAGGVPLVLTGGGRVWMTPPDAALKRVVFASNGRITPPSELFELYENLEEY